MRRFEPPNLSDTRAVVYDTETTGTDWKRDRVVGHVVATDEGSWYFPVRHEGGGNFEPEPVEAWLRDLLRRPDLRVINHALKFDVHMAANHGIEIAGPLECTMVNETLIDENQYKYGLDDVAPRYGAKKDTEIYRYLADHFGGEPTRKAQIGRFWRLPGDDPKAERYARDDGTSTYVVWIGQQKHLDAQNLRQVWSLECRTIRTLYRMERRGVRVDLERLAEVRRILGDRLLAAEEKLPKGINVRSTAQLVEWFRRIGVTNWPMTEKGNPSLTEKWLVTHEPGRATVVVRKITNLLNSFINPLEHEHVWNGRVHTNFNQLRSDDYGTVTGRLSSSGPNMQQVPKRDRALAPLFRSIFLPEPGHRWWTDDYQQCEFRIFADYMGSKTLIDGYNRVPPVDIHTVVANMLRVERDPTAKRLNLGMLFGIGAKKLGLTLGVPMERARNLRGQWDRMIPEGRQFLQQAEALARVRGWVRTRLWRRARLNRNNAHKAGSRIIQGTNADIIKLKAADIDDFLTSLCGDSVARLLLSIHDELCFSVAEGREDIAYKIRDTMQDFSEGQPITFSVPMTVEIHDGPTWAEASFPSYGREQEASIHDPEESNVGAK